MTPIAMIMLGAMALITVCVIMFLINEFKNESVTMNDLVNVLLIVLFAISTLQSVIIGDELSRYAMLTIPLIALAKMVWKSNREKA